MGSATSPASISEATTARGHHRQQHWAFLHTLHPSPHRVLTARRWIVQTVGLSPKVAPDQQRCASPMPRPASRKVPHHAKHNTERFSTCACDRPCHRSRPSTAKCPTIQTLGISRSGIRMQPSMPSCRNIHIRRTPPLFVVLYRMIAGRPGEKDVPGWGAYMSGGCGCTARPNARSLCWRMARFL